MTRNTQVDAKIEKVIKTVEDPDKRGPTQLHHDCVFNSDWKLAKSAECKFYLKKTLERSFIRQK